MPSCGTYPRICAAIKQASQSASRRPEGSPCVSSADAIFVWLKTPWRVQPVRESQELGGKLLGGLEIGLMPGVDLAERRI